MHPTKIRTKKISNYYRVILESYVERGPMQVIGEVFKINDTSKRTVWAWKSADGDVVGGFPGKAIAVKHLVLNTVGEIPLWGEYLGSMTNLFMGKEARAVMPEA